MRCVILCLMFCILAAQAHAAPPNVVIMLADDAGWGDYGHNGNTTVSTPNIDSLARDGVTLDRFFVCPVCSPTRAEFLTGRYHPRGGVQGVSTGQERLNLDERTLADAFKAAGYATGAFGKWHNGSQWPYHPMARGFDEYFGYTSGHWGEYFDAPLEDNGRMIRSRGYIVDVCTDQALAFIDRNKSKPFFCYLPFTTPHSPWAAPQEYWERMKGKPVSQSATLANQEEIDQTRCALAMLENQDWNVGRVLTKLDDLKLRDNTIVLYFSDNGPNSWRWNGGMKGRKGSTDEGGVRSTALLRWPAKLKAGSHVEQITGAIDLLPTLTALAGIPRVGDKPLDGRDLSPLLLQKEIDWPERMLFSTWAGRVSVRTQQYRLDDQNQLFDMTADPGQTTPVNNLQPEVTARLTEAVRNWREEMFGKPASEGTAAKGKGKAKGNSVDPRPIPVGYREFPITILPARDGEPQGGVKRSGTAPNCSYFVNWTSLADRMVWLIDVHTPGRYEVTIDYTCPESDAGSLVELKFRDSQLSGRVTPGWNPPLFTNQDTLPRGHGESQMKEFRPLSLGVINLEQGAGTLTLRAQEIPGRSVMDVLQVRLTLLD
ncbi:arylsulfatase [Planctomicrobium piriforme]|uniref:Arylsulfatase A n=1 Tax=Planctomicrobium piriforme TaxID=1576369 RepID=A0A1I3SDU6_9PLAN|nr:arylsulfatase [Planctomicrobium piriforme]SFJ55686.1 Arylsulfatase A [Planctomicrobium piriforme]